MKGLVAEAYQMKLGKNQSNMLKGDKAITALTDAMKKGSVKTAELIPFLDGLMRRDSAPGIAAARNSASAEQRRFENQIEKGWDNFTKGGGEDGLKYFWKMMQGFGDWWQENGFILGRYFHATMVGLNAFRLSIIELWDFFSTGEHNSLSTWIRSLGIDIDSIRQNFIDLKNATMELLGIDPQKSVGENLKGISSRLIIFVSDLNGILESIVQVVEGLAKIRKYFFPTEAEKAESTSTEAKVYGTDLANVGEFDAERNKFFRRWDNSPGKGLMDAVGGTWDATWGGVGSMKRLAFGGNTPTPLSPVAPSWKPDGWGTTPGAAIPSSVASGTPAQSTNHKVDITVKLDGNADIMAMIDKPTFYTKVAEITGGVVDNRISGALIGAPQPSKPQ